MADTAKLRQMITEILDGADLNTITAKKVRQQLEEKLEIDLADRKKEVDTLTMEVLNEKQEASTESNEEEESEEEEEKPKKAPAKRRAAAKHDSDSEEPDEEYKPKGKKAKGKKAADSDDSDDDWKGKKPAAKRGGGGGAKKGGGGGGTGYTKVCKLSPALAAVMGEENMARHEVVKRMWKLIKEKNLYDPKNKQFAICNEELLAVFGVKRFRTFGMMKYLKNHFTN